jgi:hypothetical protein
MGLERRNHDQTRLGKTGGVLERKGSNCPQ